MNIPRRARVVARIERRRLALYNRSRHLGDIALRRGVNELPWRAIDRDDRLLGVFDSLRNAVDAIADNGNGGAA